MNNNFLFILPVAMLMTLNFWIVDVHAVEAQTILDYKTQMNDALDEINNSGDDDVKLAVNSISEEITNRKSINPVNLTKNLGTVFEKLEIKKLSGEPGVLKEDAMKTEALFESATKECNADMKSDSCQIRTMQAVIHVGKIVPGIKNQKLNQIKTWNTLLREKKDTPSGLNTAERELGGLVEQALKSCEGQKPAPDCINNLDAAMLKGQVVNMPAANEEQKQEPIVKLPTAQDK